MNRRFFLTKVLRGKLQSTVDESIIVISSGNLEGFKTEEKKLSASLVKLSTNKYEKDV